MKILFHTHLALDFPEKLQEFANRFPDHEFVSVSGSAQLLAEMCAALTDDITGYKRTSPEVNYPGFRRITANLSDALENCDLCFVALPLTAATNGLIGARELVMLKGGYLVNISRGEIVQEKPLYDALSTGELKGAGLDVWYQYPEPFHGNRLPSELGFHELETGEPVDIADPVAGY